MYIYISYLYLIFECAFDLPKVLYWDNYSQVILEYVLCEIEANVGTTDSCISRFKEVEIAIVAISESNGSK